MQYTLVLEKNEEKEKKDEQLTGIATQRFAAHRVVKKRMNFVAAGRCTECLGDLPPKIL